MNKNRIRFRQLDFKLDEFKDELLDWSIEKRGCGPTSVAIVLANYGYNINPIDVAKIILTDDNDNFTNRFISKGGISNDGILYALNKMGVEYEIIKIDFNNPESQKRNIIDNLKKGNMAIIQVGPEIGDKSFQGTFSKKGHYLVVSDIDKEEKLYVINPNAIGDNQIGVPFIYEDIVREMYGRRDRINFLFIKKHN
jgi:hypothetical protein